MINKALRNSENGKFTYADYCTWDDGDSERWELIDGRAYAMAAPTLAHQRISRRLLKRFEEFLEGKTCEAFSAPCDVRLNHAKGDDTVVQPDLLVVCDPSKLADGKSVKGAPDLVIEILSPSTIFHDKVTKLKKYRQAGVREIWFVDPATEITEVFRPGNNNEPFDIYARTDNVLVSILPELTINLDEIFEPQVQQEQRQEV